MIRIRRAVVVRPMARETVGGGSGETAIDVAASAGGALVGAGEGEAGLAVVDVGGRAPGRGRVAVLAVGRETGGPVVRVRGAVVVRPMAGETVGRGSGEPAPDVAPSTVRALVGAGEREAGLVMVDVCGGAPGRRRVAVLAIGRESRGPVVRIRRAVVVRPMARETVGRGSGEPAPDVTPRAVRALVGAGERKAGLVVVDVGGGAPGRRGVAVLAGLREIARDVVRVRRGVVSGLVARVAVGRGPGETAALVARGATRRLMGPAQREAGGLVVDAGGGPPAEQGMTVLAAPGEATGGMVRVLRAEVGLDVTGAAVGGRQHVPVGLRPAVATVAVEICVNTEKRQARPVVPFPHLALVGPGLLIVTVLATEAELALVRVAMAVGASGADLREDERLMAGAAGHPRVGLPEQEARGFVLEGGSGHDRFPLLRSVAGAAIRMEIAMRIGDQLSGDRAPGEKGSGRDPERRRGRRSAREFMTSSLHGNRRRPCRGVCNGRP